MIKDKSELKPQPLEIDLTGPQGNAFCLMATARQLAIQLKLDSDAIIREMKTSDYDNLVEVFDKYFGEHVTLYR